MKFKRFTGSFLIEVMLAAAVISIAVIGSCGAVIGSNR
ncbi:hypothetical protein ES703_80473 [subsurface metagenome]